MECGNTKLTAQVYISMSLFFVKTILELDSQVHIFSQVCLGKGRRGLPFEEDSKNMGGIRQRENIYRIFFLYGNNCLSLAQLEHCLKNYFFKKGSPFGFQLFQIAVFGPILIPSKIFLLII